jgi:hypothetical protein
LSFAVSPASPHNSVEIFLGCYVDRYQFFFVVPMPSLHPPQVLRDLSELIAELSAATGLTQTQLETQFQDIQISAFTFGDRTLIPPSELDAVIDAWAAQLKAQLRGQVVQSPRKSKRSLTPVPSNPGSRRGRNGRRTQLTSARNTSARSTSARSTSVPTAVLDGKPLANSLALPADYEAFVSHLYSPSYRRILPTEMEQRRRYLEEIVNETEAGVEFLNKLSVVIASKYSGKMAPEKAYLGLRNKAAQLLAELSSSVANSPIIKTTSSVKVLSKKRGRRSRSSRTRRTRLPKAK